MTEGDRREPQTDSSGPLFIVEECHEAVIHVQLLVTVEQLKAAVVGNEINFAFLIEQIPFASEHANG